MADDRRIEYWRGTTAHCSSATASRPHRQVVAREPARRARTVRLGTGRGSGTSLSNARGGQSIRRATGRPRAAVAPAQDASASLLRGGSREGRGDDHRCLGRAARPRPEAVGSAHALSPGACSLACESPVSLLDAGREPGKSGEASGEADRDSKYASRRAKRQKGVSCRMVIVHLS